jgi:hypothetical protein
MKRIFSMILLLLILAACEGGGSANDDPFASNSIITWDRSPQTVVFRTEVVGGDNADAFLTRNQIPLCTIYGDNRVVWLNDLGDFNTQVLWDKVTDQQIQDFISYITVAQQVFNYDSGADLQPPSALQPVREVITISVSGRIHQTDSMSSTPWPLDYFETIVGFCKLVSQAPVLFEPTGAWVTVQAVPYDSNRPLQIWDSSVSTFKLHEVAERGEPVWLADNNVRVLWNIIRTSSPQVLFSDLDGNAFEVVMEVPGVHPNAPAAPQ